MGLLLSRSRSQRRFNECLSGQYLLNQRIFCHQTWYGHTALKAKCCAEKLVHCVQCQGHSEGLYNQNMTISVVSSKLLVVCNQTWFDRTASEAGVFCGKMGLLCSRSRSQWWFEMSVNVSVDNIFWITAHFVTKFGMVMQHHEPESYGHFVVVAIFKVKVTARVYMIKIWLFLLYYLNCWFFGNQTWSHDTSLEAKMSYEKNWITAFRVKVKI